jgi:hypothetical protein
MVSATVLAIVLGLCLWVMVASGMQIRSSFLDLRFGVDGLADESGEDAAAGRADQAPPADPGAANPTDVGSSSEGDAANEVSPASISKDTAVEGAAEQDSAQPADGDPEPLIDVDIGGEAGPEIKVDIDGGDADVDVDTGDVVEDVVEEAEDLVEDILGGLGLGGK